MRLLLTILLTPVIIVAAILVVATIPLWSYLQFYWEAADDLLGDWRKTP